MPKFDEDQIINSWTQNANAWTKAIQNEEIESRKLVTNQAIVDAITAFKPNTALDVGCGEGWLTRALMQHNIDTLGVDAIEALVEKASKHGVGKFQVCSYDDLAAGKLSGNLFDTVVCNFSLIGKESVHNFIKAAPSLLTANGHLFIQTLHLFTALEIEQYNDGWREGSWDGFSAEFKNPAPWYFRSLQAWVRLFSQSGLVLKECLEPRHPKTEKPLSMIFICSI